MPGEVDVRRKRTHLSPQQDFEYCLSGRAVAPDYSARFRFFMAWKAGYLKRALDADGDEIAIRQRLTIGRTQETCQREIGFPDREIGRGNSGFEIARACGLRIIRERPPGDIITDAERNRNIDIGQYLKIMRLEKRA